MTKKAPKEIFNKLILGCIVIIGFGIYLSVRSGKEKNEFNNITGKIDFLENTFGNLKKRDHRFIHITDYELVFDLFIGKRTGDFSPKFEQIDKLKIGDKITVYYADKTPLQKNQNLSLNKTVQFIDKNGEAYFIRGNKDKYGGYFFIGIGILTMILLLIGKKLGKIK
ncbi:hypothetical protein C7H62_0538 [Mesoflavibacter sp. HG96]|uniref:DUF3592 domain-containing protein n=1 Tax=Mesoflavibacter profundi TaxID=2708110 RepID=A0ABT4S064_9FLAO|nr:MULTISPECIES: hypothetical protein [Mesoflavibacter]MDA0177395.1 hypothetical protein [Mesoflavibacter profundi]QIJ88347.1 hypothetical protein C7H62_0538 [Mesoflavibacter sp. HG96]QIJ91075.1 hypothetical protein C7H56_0538 [Mesoflavibacter sp. HG37]